MNATGKTHRGTLFVEAAEVVDVQSWPDEQYVVRLAAPKTAAAAEPGSFVHVQCDESIPMRRPLSIMRADAQDGWIDVLFKIVGDGLRALASRKVGDVVSSLGPIGQGFRPHPNRPRTILVGGGVGIPPMIFLAEHLMQDRADWQPVVFMGSEIPFPMETMRSSLSVSGVEPAIDSAMSLLESWSVPSRLASLSGYDGCFDGYVTTLADHHLAALTADELEQVEIFACGPTPMLAAVAVVAQRHGVPCQVSLEEYMACAVGGCAGCTVEVRTPDGPAMRRVCVDGPVFDANAVFPAAAESA